MFAKGQSGNPAGRPKGIANHGADLAALAREWGPKCVERLAMWAMSEDSRASVAAAGMLLDRGYGRPKQELEHSGVDGKPLGPILNITMSTVPAVEHETTKLIDGNGERG